MENKVSVSKKLGHIEKIEPEGLLEVKKIVDTSIDDKSISQKEKLIKVIDEDNKENASEKEENNHIKKSEPDDKHMDRKLIKKAAVLTYNYLSLCVKQKFFIASRGIQMAADIDMAEA